jgi:WD40 repeat protein
MPSITKTATLAAQPNTQRAQTTHLSYDQRTNRIVYPSGKSIFIRSIDEPSKAIQFTGHNANTTVAKFSPSGYYVASGDESGLVKVWDVVNEDELLVKGEYQIISGRINDISWDSESKRLIIVGDGKERFGHAITWDSGNSVGEISGHSAQVNAVAIRSVRPFRAATVSDDSALVFLHGPPFKFESSVRGQHSNFIKDVKFSPNGAFLVSVGSDKKIVVYDGKTGEYLKKLDDAHDGGIFSLSFVDDDRFVTASADSSVKLWSAESLELIKSWTFEKKVENQQLGVVSAGDYVISLSYSGDLNYLTFDSDSVAKTVSGHQKSITSSIVEDGSLYTGSSDGTILKWDLSTNESTKKPGHGNLIVGLSSINNKVYSTGWDDKLNSLDGTSSLEIPEQPKSVASNDELIAVVTEGLLLAYKNDTKLYEVKLKNVGTTVGVSAEHIAVGFQNNSVSVYESKTGEHLFDLPALRSKPSYVSFSPNGEYVAVGDVSGKINLYDVAKKEIKTARWAFHTSKITSISWNKDNNYVATGSLDTNIIIYQVANPIKNIKFLNAHKEGVNTVEWISDDEIVTGGSDSTIKKWKVEF